jgi:predicted helicase
MSFDAIHNYYREVEKLKHFGGTHNELSIRSAFYKLLDNYARSKDLKLVAEVSIKGTKGKDVRPDGVLKDMLRQDWGYWESKDEDDDLEIEIQKKFDKGYPLANILFEDGISAVLYQKGNRISEVAFKDTTALDKILKNFVGYLPPEVAEFRKAIELFKSDVPKVTEALREMIITKAEQNKAYQQKMHHFLELCREVINPHITKEDIREMVIQHILTADIFNTIFDEPHFHKENNIAQELNNLTDTFFTRELRNNTLAGIKHYYDTINARAAQIADHHEKQMFLKVVYETFYKSYDPKKADRLGVVYTPNEIVRFMIDSTDYLLGKHFGKQLEDKNVEILDPATGTGTFICDIIDHITKDKLPYKYKHELHANEVEILPYYIANLNIEFTYKQKLGAYAEFENLCFVDTLDNMGFDYKDKQDDIFSLTDENAERIKRQNDRKISVIIGNPPYNANQMNENDNNKNREYPVIDKRIKDTYIKQSTAQKTKLYDMYARFYRWAMDRLNDNGIIALITNRSFIDSRTFDGFRKIVQKEFDFAYIVDTKSDVRQNPKIAGTTHNVFGIQTGVAIMFLVKNRETDKQSRQEFKLPNAVDKSLQNNGQFGLRDATEVHDADLKSETPKAMSNMIDRNGVLNSYSAYPTCRIQYIAMQDEWRKEDKLQWLTEHKLKDIAFEHIQPDKNNNWINLTENDWDEMIAVADKEVKLGKSNKAIFKLYSTGISTNRDEWIKDISTETLSIKMNHFINLYNNSTHKEPDTNIKWSRNLKQRYKKGYKEAYSESKIKKYSYRPYYNVLLYKSDLFIDEQGLLNNVFSYHNSAICVSTKSILYLASNTYTDLHFTGDTQIIPLNSYDQDGKRHDNITDWALGEFRSHYKLMSITKEDIFHYVYGVLHNPAYRTKYEQNLKRSLPRIPYYEDFYTWAGWGKALMELHLNFETVEPYPLEIHSITEHTDISNPDPLHRNDDVGAVLVPAQKERVGARPTPTTPKAKLKADKERGIIILDEETSLKGIPAEAWSYKLGNRSALEWILDQYKEKKPKDPTIAKLFNTYKFADYKDKVIDLLLRVTTVSVETMKIVQEMEKLV